MPTNVSKVSHGKGTPGELDVDVGELWAGTQSKPHEPRVPYVTSWPDLAEKTHLTSVLTPPTLGTFGILSEHKVASLTQILPGSVSKIT